MVYICPECEKEFSTEEKLVKHYLPCWKSNHSNQKSKSAPHSEAVNTRSINQEVLAFFESFQKE